MAPILNKFGVVYLCGEPRTGKTLTAMSFSIPGTLVVTSKKAIEDIEKQAKAFGVQKNITVINYESLKKSHLVKCKAIILDEAHRIGKFPKPSKKITLIRKYGVGKKFYILLSGTPSPESYCQLFHQFHCINKGPWSHFVNFYKFARKYVNITESYIGIGRPKKNYKDMKSIAVKMFNKYKVTMTQDQAGIKGKVKESFHTVQAPDNIKFMLSILMRKGMLTKKAGKKTKVFVNCDTASKMSSAFHQLCGGSIIDIDREGHSLSDYKAQFIKKEFFGLKLAIFYQYKQEFEILKKVFPNWTSNAEEFRKSKKKTWLSQFQSGREGVDLQTADALVGYSVPFSATSYFQFKARTQNIFKKEHSELHWIFSDLGIEQAIYNMIVNKKDFTTKHFEDYARRLSSNSNSKVVKKDGLVTGAVAGYKSQRNPRPYGTKKRKVSTLRKGRSGIHRSKKAR